ncbi:hypothetical protein HT031_002713 [Scenedesmus sp. PABB004]|nr:hypothetical protein HT031_002713 [Scenedesmus sp. PABB004]
MSAALSLTQCGQRLARRRGLGSPAAARRRPSAPALRSAAPARLQRRAALPQAQQSAPTQLGPPAAAGAAAALPLLLLARAAAAAAGEDAEVDAAFSAVQEQSAGSTDLVVSVLAAVVFALLVLVTGGVAYLTLKTWLDDKQEKEDRTTPAPLASSASAAADTAEAEAKKRVRVRREKRGFGGN